MADATAFDPDRCGGQLPPLPSVLGRRLLADCRVPDPPAPLDDPRPAGVDLPPTLGGADELWAEITSEDGAGGYAWVPLRPRPCGRVLDGPIPAPAECFDPGSPYDGAPYAPAFEVAGRPVEPGAIVRLYEGARDDAGVLDYRFEAPGGGPPDGCAEAPPLLLGPPTRREGGDLLLTAYELCFRDGRPAWHALGEYSTCRGHVVSGSSSSSEPGDQDPCPFECGTIYDGYTATGIGPRVGATLGSGTVEYLREVAGELQPTGITVTCLNVAGPVDPDTYVLFARTACGTYRVIVADCGGA